MSVIPSSSRALPTSVKGRLCGCSLIFKRHGLPQSIYDRARPALGEVALANLSSPTNRSWKVLDQLLIEGGLSSIRTGADLCKRKVKEKMIRRAVQLAQGKYQGFNDHYSTTVNSPKPLSPSPLGISMRFSSCIVTVAIAHPDIITLPLIPVRFTKKLFVVDGLPCSI